MSLKSDQLEILFSVNVQHTDWPIGANFRRHLQTAKNQIAASDQFLHCLLTECSFKFLNENVNFYLSTLKFEIDLSN